MYRILLTAALLSLVFSPSPAAQSRRGTVAQAAPITLLPDATRQPLRVAAPGTSLVVLKEEGAWLQIQFQDPDYGLRTGYVQKRFVTMPDAQRPLDLSVPTPPSEGDPRRQAPVQSGAAPTIAAPSAAVATPRLAGTATQVMVFRKVDYSEIVGQEERSHSARLVLDPVGRTLTFADEGSGETKAVYAKVPYESVTKIVYEQASHRRYTAGVLVSPFLFFTKAKKHWLTLEVKNVPELPQGFLYARLDKDNYRQVLSALRAGTGLTIDERVEN